MNKKSWSRWCVFGVPFFFLLIHQSNKLVLGSLLTQIMDTFNIDVAQIGCAVLTLLLAGSIARELSLQVAILVVCISAWALGTVFLASTADLLPHDIRILRDQIRTRAELTIQAYNA